MSTNHKLPYDPKQLKREMTPYYISASDAEINHMLSTLGHKKLDDLYGHIPSDIRYKEVKNWGSSLQYDDLLEHLEEVAAMNIRRTSFIGDGLKHYKVTDIVPLVSNVRGLTTAYTPYQPERAQGTLQSLWIYSSVMSALTGFEAVNASLYDRSTALYEAINCAKKIKRNSKAAIVCDSMYPGDKRVLDTMIQGIELEIHYAPINAETGTTDLVQLKALAQKLGADLGSIAFPQVNSLGNIEDADAITDLVYELGGGVQAIAVVDPMLLATGGLKRPVDYGSQGQGAHIVVGEAQHLAIAPGFGGPGLGMFAIRYNDKNKNSIRSTPGRFLSKAFDANGRVCKTLVLSTREQHIRRDKATSNICSNQSFLATLVGASCLNRGDAGMTEAMMKGRRHALKMAKELTRFKGVELSYKNTPFFNEFVLNLPMRTSELLEKARNENIHLGVDVSERCNNRRGNQLLISFFDIHEDSDLKKLLSFFEKELGRASKEGQTPKEIPASWMRKEAVGIPQFQTKELHEYYEKLGKQNASPDDNIYALGSCTMKYNPYINDYTAGLDGFTQMHPQAPEEDVQGCMHILYETQEMFKGMLGLAAVTTQPVAGAHGEYVALKMFQAYHRENEEEELRDVMLIPHSAHGTNPASAAAAGFKEIVEINANPQTATIDMTHLSELIQKYGNRIAGIMVTNPNTSGIFEAEFKKMSDMIHAVGGLVYMDGANLNAIAGWVDLSKMGVDAVHSNLHKTWSIPHGGGGPGDAIVAVSHRLKDFVPGMQVVKDNDYYRSTYAPKAIGYFHRHHGNFLHKVRCYTYLKALGAVGTRKMTSVAVLAANYLHHHLSTVYPTLPAAAKEAKRMHEFILTIPEETFAKIEKAGVSHAEAIAKVGKLFLDFGVHAPTVAFPEVYGLMVEPTESFTQSELDRFIAIVKEIFTVINETPEVLQTVPHFTPVNKIDEVGANKTPVFAERLTQLPEVFADQVDVQEINKMDVKSISKMIWQAHQKAKGV